MDDREYLQAPKLAPGVGAVATTRAGGLSDAPYASLNLGLAAGDETDTVHRNRALVQNDLGLQDIRWLRQKHTNQVAFHRRVDEVADAHWTTDAHVGLAILTADCLPVVMASSDGAAIAAAHAGWRGLAAGILEATIAQMPCDPAQLTAWIGPAIGPCCYEIDAPVRDAFCRGRLAPFADDSIFRETRPDHWLFDLPQLAKRALIAAGVSQVYVSGQCTVCVPEQYYSYRRDGVTGRQATIIWRTR